MIESGLIIPIPFSIIFPNLSIFILNWQILLFIFSSYTQLFLSFYHNYFISHPVINNLTLKIMNLELDLYPIISNKIIRQKDWKSIKEHKPGFWSRKDIEGNRLVRTQRGYFLNNKNISVTSAQSFILSHGIQDVPQNIF